MGAKAIHNYRKSYGSWMDKGKWPNFYLIILLTFFAFAGANDTLVKTVEITLPEKEPVELRPYATINFPAINEASGLVKSQLWKDVFWIHNDSGDEPRIFPINDDGSIIKPSWMKDYAGIRIPDAVNVDWESIATDDRGNLYIGDIGNNSSTRRDLCIYVVEEPYPFQTVTTCVSKRIPFYYSDQKIIPPKKENFDAEAMFWRDGKLYILTKHRSDRYTKLYRLDSMSSFEKNSATLIGQFNIQGQVSGADISPDGMKLVVLTYNAVWMFEVDKKSDDFFKGRISWLPIKAGYVEAICLDGKKIIIASEEGKLYKLYEDDLMKLKE